MLDRRIALLSALAKDCKNGDDILVADHIARELNDIVADFSKHLIRAGNECSEYFIELFK